jgi:hypothetical protein
MDLRQWISVATCLLADLQLLLHGEPVTYLADHPH